MKKSQHLPDRAERSLIRLLPRLEAQYSNYITSHPSEWQIFLDRLQLNFKRLFDLLIQIYGSQYDFYYHLENLLYSLAQAWIDRSEGLKKLDQQRCQDANWFQANKMIGGVCYVDLFAGNLEGVRQHIPYLKELGLTYLHLMPLFRSPKAENDGGYAISSYREVDPALGTMQQLSELASDLRQNGISPVLDFVFNHTSDEHEWANRAKAGDPVYQNYYLIFPDRQLPDAYERNLREIFPDEHPGAFTYFPEIESWVWTTFHSYQWDLNYQNPEVFIAMVQEMLSLANVGVEILRLDAVAFIWKKMGTSCENLPEAHLLIQAFNAVARIVAPALLFKSEAIVAPDEVIRYINPDECQLSYNPLLMALMWETLATREVKLLSESLRQRFKIPDGCAWVNYVRSHDDIGWTFSDDDSWKLGINGYDHRHFLNSFYTGQFPGSFARGLPFQENPKTGDCRISGTCASLAGLEKAINQETSLEVDLAIARILLLHGVILFIGGIPLIYLGDELGTLNDYSYRDNPAKSHDSRWVHRPRTDWNRVELRSDPQTIEGRIFSGFQRLIAVRKKNIVFSDGDTQMIDCGTHVLGFLHTYQAKRVLVLANFCEKDQIIQANLLRIYGLGYQFRDLVTNKNIRLKDITLKPYQLMALQ
ncbi:MAG TPA: alpha-amylase family protein [Anaerolineaceae bacterium]|nr:alpha-amylase family protein [Anaerolineaceae bacterium]